MKIIFLFLSLMLSGLSVYGSDKEDLLKECEGGFEGKIIEYGHIQFRVPEVQKTGFILRPNKKEVPSELAKEETVRTVKEPWNFNRLLLARQPLKIGQVAHPGSFSAAGMVSVLDMPIKFPGTDYLIPDNFKQLAASLQTIIDFEHSINDRALKNYYAYLTVHQSWVDQDQYQRRPGLHVDGFQGIERPEKEAIEHSYLIFDAVPTVFTKQKFQFFNFDFGRFNVFSELDRQAELELEYPADPYGIYFADAYTVHRADRATERVLRTFVRVTYSVAIFDRLGLTDNPLFPYSWERKEKRLQESLEKYVPPTGLDKLLMMDSLASVPGNRLGIIGIGEGSDGLQAAQLAALLNHVGKKAEFVASFRSPQTFLNGQVLRPGLIRVTKDFRMSGRLFEDLIADDFPTYLVFDGELADLRANLNHLIQNHDVDGLVFVDSGGNVLSPIHLQENLLNDHRTLLAAEGLPVPAKTVFIISPGVNVPPEAHLLMAQLNARRYRPTDVERELILNNYHRWQMSGPHPRTFAFVPMIWQQALRGEFGPQQFPTLYPGDPKYPVTPENQDLMVIPFDELMRLLKSP